MSLVDTLGRIFRSEVLGYTEPQYSSALEVSNSLSSSVFSPRPLPKISDLPPDIQPVRDFQLNQYLGKWYEIYRLENQFEMGLDHVTAEYSLNNDGSVRVDNKGYPRESDNNIENRIGRAIVAEDDTRGYLGVSFFGDLYEPYIITKIGKGYKYAYVTSDDKKYLWLLSRSPKVNKRIEESFIDMATNSDYNIKELVRVDQSRNYE